MSEKSPGQTGGQAPNLRARLLLNAVPGILAGAWTASFLFFLNPQVPFGPMPLLRAVVVLALPFGIVSCAALSLFSWRSPHRTRRSMPWLVTVVFALIALSYWLAPSYLTVFLPPGINARLLKAAAWLTLGTLVCFFIAWRHSLHSRPYRLRTRIGLALLTVALLVITAERREAFQRLPVIEPLVSTVERQVRPNVFVVGLEGATLDAILPLAEQGHLPFFSRLLEDGAYARVRAVTPRRRAALWTTLATGKHPYKHGVVSEQIYLSRLLAPGAELSLLPPGLSPGSSILGLRSRRTDGGDRQSLALWEILARLDRPAAVVDWPVSYPATEELSFVFSDRYFTGDFSRRAASPPGLAERGVLFQVPADELDPELVGRLGPEVPLDLLRVLADDLWRESLSTFVLEQDRDVRAFFLLLPGLGEVSRRYFAGYSSVQFAGAQQPAMQRAAHFVTAYYRHLDSFLGTFWDNQPQPKVLAVVSAHGFEAPEGWRKFLGALRGRALEGSSQSSPDGVFFLAGEGAAAGVSLGDADIVDVMPTLLYALGFPIARDLDGRVLTAAFEPSFLAGQPLTFVPSYETLNSSRAPLIRLP